MNGIFQAGYNVCSNTGIGTDPGFDIDVQCDEGNKNGLDNGSFREKAHELFVADEVLYQVIKKGGGGVSYIFQKVG